MANVLFTRTSDPNSKPVTDGQLIFDTSGNGKMYLDNGTNRLEMGGALTVDATLSKTSTNPVQNKAVAGVMLDTLSDIGNVTSKGFLTDALAVKELNTNVNELNNSLSNLGKATLLASPNANGTVTVSNLSVFKYIYIEIGWTGTNLIFDPSVIPYDVKKNGNKYNLQALVASASYKASNHAIFQYISDTSISVELMDSANIRPKIYGIK